MVMSRRTTAGAAESPDRKVLEGAVRRFRRSASKALEGQVPDRRQLAKQISLPETTLCDVLNRGQFTFDNWPQICVALGKDPIDELARGRAELHREEDREREAAYRAMLERAEADTMVSLAKKLSAEERARVCCPEDLLATFSDRFFSQALERPGVTREMAVMRQLFQASLDDILEGESTSPENLLASLKRFLLPFADRLERWSSANVLTDSVSLVEDESS